MVILKYVVRLITTLKVLTSTNSIIQLLRLCQIVVLGNLAWNWVDDCILMSVHPRLSDSAKNGHKAVALQKFRFINRAGNDGNGHRTLLIN